MLNEKLFIKKFGEIAKYLKAEIPAASILISQYFFKMQNWTDVQFEKTIERVSDTWTRPMVFPLYSDFRKAFSELYANQGNYKPFNHPAYEYAETQSWAKALKERFEEKALEMLPEDERARRIARMRLDAKVKERKRFGINQNGLRMRG